MIESSSIREGFLKISQTFLKKLLQKWEEISNVGFLNEYFALFCLTNDKNQPEMNIGNT